MNTRILVAAATMLLLAAPAFAAPQRTAESCSMVRSRTVDLTGPGSADVVEVRSIAAPAGAAAPNCNGATMLLTVRRGSDKDYLYGFVSVMNRMDLIEGHAGPPYGPSMMAAFLDEWVMATVGTTNDAPPFGWSGVTTALSAEDYAAVRAKRLPMLCHATSALDRKCAYVDPDAGGMLTDLYEEMGG